jgi:hypothetical protein
MELLETRMKRMDSIDIPVHDYGAAVQGAVSWLGDRYLLAEPVPRLNEEHRPYFAKQRSWHPAVVAGALARSTRRYR